MDDREYTFNGVGEYWMLNATNPKGGDFRLQARTIPARGDLNRATIFSVGVAKEDSSSKVEVRVKNGGMSPYRLHFVHKPCI